MFPGACIHGRFQVLHWDHIAYFQRAAEKYGRLYIGLTALGRDQGNRNDRESTARNPLTFWERAEMWRLVLRELTGGIDHVIGPFPIERPELLTDYVPLSCVCATTVRERWNDEKIRRLEEAGYEIDVLFTDFDKPMYGERVRQLIASGSQEWISLVPPSVAAYLTEIGLGDRLRALRAGAGIADG